MIFNEIAEGFKVERDQFKISKISEVQTRKGYLSAVEDVGDQLFNKEHFVLFKTDTGKACKIKIGALKNPDVIVMVLNFTFQKQDSCEKTMTSPTMPNPEERIINLLCDIKKEDTPTLRMDKEKQIRLATIRLAAERIRDLKI